MTSKVVFRENNEIRIDDVRLSYPHLWKPYAGGKNDDGQPGKEKYSCKGLIDLKTRKEDILKIRNAARAFSASQLKDKNGKGIVVPDEKLFIRNGSGSGKPEQEGMWIISASEDTPPTVLGRGNVALTEKDGIIFAGCRVSLLIRMWAQDNKFGKRINANLLLVRFMAKDEPFSQAGARPDAKEVFSDFEDDDADGGDLGGSGLDDDDDLI